MRYLNWPQKVLYDLNVLRRKRIPLKTENPNYQETGFYQSPISQALSIPESKTEQLYEEQPPIGSEYPTLTPGNELPEPVFEASPGLDGSPAMGFAAHEPEAEALPGGGPEPLDLADRVEIEHAISQASQVPGVGDYRAQTDVGGVPPVPRGCDA